MFGLCRPLEFEDAGVQIRDSAVEVLGRARSGLARGITLCGGIELQETAVQADESPACLHHVPTSYSAVGCECHLTLESAHLTAGGRSAARQGV